MNWRKWEVKSDVCDTIEVKKIRHYIWIPLNLFWKLVKMQSEVNQKLQDTFNYKKHNSDTKQKAENFSHVDVLQFMKQYTTFLQY